MDETFQIEDEELDEIEYLEILTMDEIIKDNPYFIAFNESELYNELFNVFRDEKKALALKNLFYEIIDNDKKQEGILKSFDKYVFVCQTRKKDFAELDKESDSEYFNNLASLNTVRHNDAKNRYFFAIEYDDSDLLKIKPESKIITEVFTKDKAEFPILYPVFDIDDVNIPIIAMYYSVPYASDNDYMYKKVLSHYFNKKHINYISSDSFTSVQSLIKTCRPNIDEALNDFSEEIIDYESIDNFLRKYDMSMNFLVEDDFHKLCEFVSKIITDKERKNVYKTVRSKQPDLLNKKMVFFDNLKITLQLIGLTEKAIEVLQNLRQIINDNQMNIVSQDIGLLYDSIYDIIENINNGNVNLEQVVDNIKFVQSKIITNYNLQTISNLIQTNEELDDITAEFERIKDDFIYCRTHLFNYENDDKRFVSYYHETKDIVEGNNEDKYEGVPAVLKNNDYEDFEEMGEDFTAVVEITNAVAKTDLEKYWLNIKYKDDGGFLELIRIILPMMHTILTSAGLGVNYYLMTEELFNRFRGIPMKLNMLKQVLQDASIVLGDTVLQDIVKIKPSTALTVDLNMGTEIKNHIININKSYSNIFNDAFVMAMSWVIIHLQEGILNNSLAINENLLNPVYIDKWYAYGAPLQPKEKNGIMYYMTSIVDDLLAENNDYLIDKSFKNAILENIERVYKDNIEDMRQKYAQNKNKKVEKGVLMQRVMVENIKNKKYDKIASDYIDALVYMPGVNYRKIHKFLLGCCLQKIGRDFRADIDLHENARKDLIEIKRKFATRKETNKKRYTRFLPMADDNPQAETDYQDDIEYIVPYDDYKTKTASKDVQDWLDDMKDKNALLPNNIIDEFKNNTRHCVQYIESYIKILQTTARNRNSDLHNVFIVANLNYKSVLIGVLKILNAREYDDENIIRLQKLSIESIRNILIDLQSLNRIINEDNRQDIERINAYICARALCLPCNPDMNVNNYLVSVMDIPQIFIEDNAKKMHNSVLNHLKYATFPDMDEITSFLNSKREENKQMKLNILNNKSVEENQLISKLKQAGIKNDLMKIEEANETIENYYENDDENADGEAEYIMEVEDDEAIDIDNMDRMEMGFIYS